MTCGMILNNLTKFQSTSRVEKSSGADLDPDQTV